MALSFPKNQATPAVGQAPSDESVEQGAAPMDQMDLGFPYPGQRVFPTLPPEVFDWQRQWLDALPKWGTAQALTNSLGAWTALLHGQSGFFVPRAPPPYAALPGAPGATSFYSTAPLRQTLEALVDFERINHPASPRFAVGAVNVRNGNFAYFDNRKTTIRVEHVLASAALPPAFAAVEIDGEFYWDGGLVSNTPLEYVIESTPRSDTLALQVDLWGARGALPRTLGDVLERQKDIQYSSRTRRGTDSSAEKQRLRLALGELVAMLPGKRMPAALAHAFDAWVCTKVLNIVHLIYQAKSYEGSTRTTPSGRRRCASTGRPVGRHAPDAGAAAVSARRRPGGRRHTTSIAARPVSNDQFSACAPCATVRATGRCCVFHSATPCSPTAAPPRRLRSCAAPSSSMRNIRRHGNSSAARWSKPVIRCRRAGHGATASPPHNAPATCSRRRKCRCS